MYANFFQTTPDSLTSFKCGHLQKNIYIYKYIFRSNSRGLAPLGPARPDKFINLATLGPSALASRGIKKLLPSQIPGRHNSFEGVLQETFSNSNTGRSGPIEATSLSISWLGAFLAVAFPPVVVGSPVVEHAQSPYRGKHFPQFSHSSGSTIKYEICIPQQKWAMENHQKYHKLKYKQVLTQSILDGAAV